MILRRLELQAFGCLRDEVVEFMPGMNLVSGPNETGKTTLARSVAAILFGDAEGARFAPWDDPGVCRAALVLEANGRQVRLERDFVSGCVTWFEAEDDDFEVEFRGYPEAEGALRERDAHLTRLQDLLGMCRQEEFQALGYGFPSEGWPGCCPRHLEDCFSARETAELRDIMNTLQAEYRSLGGGAEAEGQLEQVGRRLGELGQEWFALQESIRQCQRDQAALSAEELSAEDPVEESPQVSEPPQADGGLPAGPAATAAAAAPVEKSPFDGAVRRAELEAELDKTGLPRCIPDVLPDLLAESAAVRQAMAEQKRALDACREERRKCRAPDWKKPLAGLAVLWAAMTVWVITRSTLLPLWAGLPATGLVAGWYVWRLLQARSAGQVFEARGTALEAGIDGYREQLAELTDRFEALGLSPSPVEMVRMQKNLSRHRRLLEELRQLQEAPEACPERDVDTLSACGAGAAEDTGGQVPVATSEPMPEAGGEWAAAAGQQAGGLNRLLEARSRVEAEGDMLRARESRLKRRSRTLHLACELLGETLTETSGSDLEHFVPILQQALGHLTAGAIDKVRITSQYVVQLPGPDGAWLPVERFGSATRTLVQLALCLAFNAMQGEAARLPLLLDDPLCNLDKKRRGQVLKVLEQCAQEQQVILFSHDESLRRRAQRDGWHLVPLGTPGPTVAASSEEKNKDDGQLSFL